MRPIPPPSLPCRPYPAISFCTGSRMGSNPAGILFWSMYDALISRSVHGLPWSDKTSWTHFTLPPCSAPEQSSRWSRRVELIGDRRLNPPVPPPSPRVNERLECRVFWLPDDLWFLMIVLAYRVRNDAQDHGANTKAMTLVWSY